MHRWRQRGNARRWVKGELLRGMLWRAHDWGGVPRPGRLLLRAVMTIHTGDGIIGAAGRWLAATLGPAGARAGDATDSSGARWHVTRAGLFHAVRETRACSCNGANAADDAGPRTLPCAHRALAILVLHRRHLSRSGKERLSEGGGHHVLGQRECEGRGEWSGARASAGSGRTAATRGWRWTGTTGRHAMRRIDSGRRIRRTRACRATCRVTTVSCICAALVQGSVPFRQCRCVSFTGHRLGERVRKQFAPGRAFGSPQR